LVVCEVGNDRFDDFGSCNLQLNEYTVVVCQAQKEQLKKDSSHKTDRGTDRGKDREDQNVEHNAVKVDTNGPEDGRQIRHGR